MTILTGSPTPVWKHNRKKSAVDVRLVDNEARDAPIVLSIRPNPRARVRRSAWRPVQRELRPEPGNSTSDLRQLGPSMRSCKASLSHTDPTPHYQHPTVSFNWLTPRRRVSYGTLTTLEAWCLKPIVLGMASPSIWLTSSSRSSNSAHICKRAGGRRIR